MLLPKSCRRINPCVGGCPFRPKTSTNSVCFLPQRWASAPIGLTPRSSQISIFWAKSKRLQYRRPISGQCSRSWNDPAEPASRGCSSTPCKSSRLSSDSASECHTSRTAAPSPLLNRQLAERWCQSNANSSPPGAQRSSPSASGPKDFATRREPLCAILSRLVDRRDGAPS